jgi:predicted transcriptional regulator
MPRARAGASELQAALQRLGARRVEATLVATLADAGGLGTREIVDRTGLRQPEVSVGMQVLRRRGWVEAEPIPRQGKGRPMHRYRLAVATGQVRRHYEEMGRAAVEELQVAVQVVKKRLG